MTQMTCTLLRSPSFYPPLLALLFYTNLFSSLGTFEQKKEQASRDASE